MSEFLLPIRPEVLSLTRYAPGRSIVGAEKISSNEMPAPPSEQVREAMRDVLDNVNRYPELTGLAVREAIAQRYDCLPDQVCLGTGSSAILVAALSTVCVEGSRVVYPWRSFESYPIAVPVSHGTPVPVALDVHARNDCKALAEQARQGASALIVCSPNNPTGPALSFEEIADLVSHVPPSVLIIVDEAYIDFATDPAVRTAIPLIADHPNVLVMRTFSKAHALAGVRVGYAIGDERLIGAIGSVSIPFGVSTFAQAGALASLRDESGVRAAVKEVVSERERILTELRSLGVAVPDSQANFYFLPGFGADFVSQCADAGLVVRPFPEGVRVTVGSREANDRLISVVRSYQPTTTRRL